jgi:CPA2 family monovalent cation:H+ antiporter-2
VAVATLFLTPYLVALAPPAGAAFEHGLARIGLTPKRPETPADAAGEGIAHHIILVGFGPAGRAIADTLEQQNKKVFVIDLNPRLVALARERGYPAAQGDATRPGLLEVASVQKADAVVVTLPDHRLSAAVVNEAKTLCPSAAVLARARYSSHVPMLEDAGAHAVVDEEASVGRALGVALRRSLSERQSSADLGEDRDANSDSDRTV